MSLLTVLVSLVAVLGAFLIYVASKSGDFRYEHSGVIQAPASKIFPYLSQLRLGGEWSPYEKRDPTMKKSISGTDGAPGAVLNFEGKSSSGTGTVEILRVLPETEVDLRLTMVKPFKGTHLIKYRLTPEGNGTRVSWVQEGKGEFMGRLMMTLINCEKMFRKDMEEGLTNLRAVVK